MDNLQRHIRCDDCKGDGHIEGLKCLSCHGRGDFPICMVCNGECFKVENGDDAMCTACDGSGLAAILPTLEPLRYQKGGPVNRTPPPHVIED